MHIQYSQNFLYTFIKRFISICTYLNPKLTSDTSLWQLSTDLVSSCSCVRISHKATVVSKCRSPLWSSSSLADKFMLITLTCFCKLSRYVVQRCAVRCGDNWATIQIQLHVINLIGDNAVAARGRQQTSW